MYTQTLGDVIDSIRLPSEDATLHPQWLESTPPTLVYHFLMMAKDSVLYNDNENKKRRYGIAAPEQITVSCVDVCKVDRSECPCDARTGCYWYRTAKPLPDFIGDTPSKITLIDGRDMIDHVPWEDMSCRAESFIPFHSSRAYTIKNYTDGKYLFIETDLELEKVSVTAPFKNYAELLEYSCMQNGKNMCSILDQPFSLRPEFSVQIMDLVLKLLAGFFRLSVVPDTKADMRDGSKEGVQP